MANRFFDLVGGVKKIRLKGKKQERVINMASARGIYVWGIKKVGDRLEFKVRSSGFEALKNIAEENRHELEILEEKGFYLLRDIIKRRLGFITGAVIFILALYFLSSFVWTLEVSGNKKIEKSKILITAAKYGLYEGAPKWRFSRSEVEEGILDDLSQLSYAKVDIKGVKVTIEVVEKILPDENVNAPCHIVAARDGIIYDMLVLQGQPYVKIGDVVAKGDILISGIIFPENNLLLSKNSNEEEIPAEKIKPYKVRARGEVKARVWYEGYGECPLQKEEIIFTGKKKKQRYFVMGSKVWFWGGYRKTGFELAQKETREKSINTPWGKLGIGEEILLEQTKKIASYSDEEALKIAKEKALKSLEAKLGKDKKILEIRTEVVSAPSDSLVRLKAEAEVIENIAVTRLIL